MRSALRCVLVCGAAFVCVSATIPPAFASALGGGPWSRPVGGPVVRVFDPPRTPFGPGHLGVDFATAPASPVRAAGAGVVVFAGRVGSGLHVVIRHPGDIRTSLSFLATARVVAGQGIERGAIVGTSGGTGPGHGSGVLHFGVRVGAAYVDPMLLFTPVDLAAVVHLATPRGGAAATAGPVEHDPPGPERAALVDAIRVDAREASPSPPPAWWDDARARVAEARSVVRPTAPYRRSSAARAPTTRAPAGDASRSTAAPAAAIAATGMSLAGVAAARRRRRSRRW